MVGWIISKLNIKTHSLDDKEYIECIRDLIDHDMVRSMKKYIQHGDIDCLEHSLYVSYSSYLACRRMGLDYRSAARGGLLHDFFLYDWHIEKPYKGLHGLKHSYISLQNANHYFHLNRLEQDIICKHMWPLTIKPPKYRETCIVIAADKYCAFMEIFDFGERKDVRRLKSLLSY
ncbi:hypothetical protein Sgly_1752 [Syntrophobotulus glycolicus DSM 8271]|uniref:Metal dependent phosphohydrolase n=1 Tax=Syntrophobotulus glycolicus (strain DSM 8271 / FlGlyR) TaxID=645991 RepID=F0SZG3_SYNGF|nr:HD family phosphohydrolase [Syntrophobotulus glycolicus]ADY56049.1 hypothetical protein Sgly_1752 [Syntrophobotulus glycolicus DSM 8271]